MNATSEARRDSWAMASSSASTFSRVPSLTKFIWSSSALAATAAERRPEMRPSFSPARRASTRPTPSREWKRFTSSPPTRQNVPSVRTPSTSNRIMRIPAAFARSSSFMEGGNARPSEVLAQPPEIVEVKHSHDTAVLVRDHERSDAPLLHQGQRGGRRFAPRHGHRVFRHALGGGSREEALVLLEPPSQVAVGDDADQTIVAVDDARDPEPLPRHLVDHVAHEGIDPHFGDLGAAVHRILDPHELESELPIRMERA